MRDLHDLPKLRDSLSYLYVEHAVIEREDTALLVMQETGKTTLPVANLCVLLAGPGTSITHAAVGLLAESGTSLMWVGQDAQVYYAQGCGETRRGYHLLRQAELASDPKKRMGVVMRMYEKRFGYHLTPDLTIEQIRGMEGVRVRTAYAAASRQYGVAWQGRRYDRADWGKGDPVNRALSAGNAVLNGICHAGIVSGGYSAGLGFVHTGRSLSFVFDIADLYKARITIPVAFQTVAEGVEAVESRARAACREVFRETKLLEQILPDIDELLEVQSEGDWAEDREQALPEPWWEPFKQDVEVS